MRETNPTTLQRVSPTSQDIALSSVLAVGFIAFALFISQGKSHSAETLLWILGAGWLGRTVEKIALRWKISRLEQSAGNTEKPGEGHSRITDST